MAKKRGNKKGQTESEARRKELAKQLANYDPQAELPKAVKIEDLSDYKESKDIAYGVEHVIVYKNGKRVRMMPIKLKGGTYWVDVVDKTPVMPPEEDELDEMREPERGVSGRLLDKSLKEKLKDQVTTWLNTGHLKLGPTFKLTKRTVFNFEPCPCPKHKNPCSCEKEWIITTEVIDMTK